jgi:hypothetical protein
MMFAWSLLVMLWAYMNALMDSNAWSASIKLDFIVITYILTYILHIFMLCCVVLCYFTLGRILIQYSGALPKNVNKAAFLLWTPIFALNPFCYWINSLDVIRTFLFSLYEHKNLAAREAMNGIILVELLIFMHSSVITCSLLLFLLSCRSSLTPNVVFGSGF